MREELAEKRRSWREVALIWIAPESLAMLFLGFSAGLPILLIFSSLSVWLTEAGVVRSTVTFFSWAALGYSFKFLWAPIVDMLPLPYFTKKLGRRKAWLLLAQLMVICAIVLMASTNPAAGGNSLVLMALGAVLLGFSSATQDIVIDAYRIESAASEMQAMLASMYIAGYRMGMLVAGAGALIIADLIGSSADHYVYSAWQTTYLSMAAVMMVGVGTTLLIKEPESSKRKTGLYSYSPLDYAKFVAVFIGSVIIFSIVFFFSKTYLLIWAVKLGLAPGGQAVFSTFIVEASRFLLGLICAVSFAWVVVLAGFVPREMVYRSYISPIQDFLTRFGGKTAVVVLLLIGFYRVSDIVLGVISNVFYVDLGFSKTAIAGITKTFGLAMTLAGGFLGGIFTARFGVYKILFLGGLLSSVTNLLFVLLARSGSDLNMLTMVIAADNLSAGIATTAFVAFLSSLTNVSFTAMQYALFSSLMTLFPKLLGGYSGTIISTVGYESFFMMTAVAGLPVLALILLAKKLHTAS